MNIGSMTRNLSLCGAMLLALGATGSAFAHDKNAEKKTFVGHVVGLACYFGPNSIGQERLHAQAPPFFHALTIYHSTGTGSRFVAA